MATATAVAVKRFERPDETRPFHAHGHADIVEVCGRIVGLGTFEPGWTWAADVKPIAGTDSCQAFHLGYCMSGRMRIRMEDGSTQDIGPGDAYAIQPGHDAEVLGDEPCVMLDFSGFGEYAKPH